MTLNTEKGRALRGPSQEVFDIGGDAQTDVILPQLIARPVPVQTSGRTEFAARCPKCRDWHRHVALGLKTAPCGAVYTLEFKGAA